MMQSRELFPLQKQFFNPFYSIHTFLYENIDRLFAFSSQSFLFSFIFVFIYLFSSVSYGFLGRWGLYFIDFDEKFS
ncbi:hypothetical protein HQ29_03150 [Porphyromonas canoris]|nr:hypothetical protein HQ29_03150 [Porphyromonas canoris]